MPEKYQDEIEEILRGIEEQEPPSPPRRPQPIIDDMPRANREEAPLYRDRPRGSKSSNSRWNRITPGRVALAGFIFLALGLALNSMGFGWLVWLGLLSLAGAYLLFFVRPRPINKGKRWRGRAVETQGPSPWQRFKRWMSE
jgi:hypothetical protein